MTSSTLLEIYLLIIVFVLGALTTVAVKYARTHFGPAKPVLSPEHPDLAEEILTPQVRQHLLQDSEVKFESAVQHSSSKLQQDLEVSAEHIRNLVNRLATEIVADEMQRYRDELGRLRSQAQTEMSGISADVAKHETELKAKMAAEIEAEKQVLIKQIDTKLGDAVASFLSETLQHNVDLGNQTDYLVAMLEEHKADFVKEVGAAHEAKPTK
ncbi:MAG: hypothetical protein ACREGG_05015 [Candidatus Saccharimonadales bacterium]